MRIITDSASLYSQQEGKEIGIEIISNFVIINNESYREFEDIGREKFLEMVEAGGVPSSSQPAIGDVMEVFDQSDEEVLYLSIGDGLSGAYQNAMGARNIAENKERIHVINTRTLAGPQRYLVQKARKLREEGMNIEKIKDVLYQCIETSVSFVIPVDFEFLKRSGRLTPLAAKIGGLIKIIPVLTQTEDKTRITPFTVKRSRKKAVDAIAEHLESIGVDETYLISVSHAGAPEAAKEVFDQIRQKFIDTEMELLQLSPALMTHGGPGCIVVQAIQK